MKFNGTVEHTHKSRLSICKCIQAKSLSHIQLFATLWTIAHQAPLSMVILQTKYWSELPCRPSGDLSDPGIKTESPAIPVLKVDCLPLSHWGSSSIAHGPANLHEYKILVDSCCMKVQHNSKPIQGGHAIFD